MIFPSYYYITQISLNILKYTPDVDDHPIISRALIRAFVHVSDIKLISLSHSFYIQIPIRLLGLLPFMSLSKQITILNPTDVNQFIQFYQVHNIKWCAIRSLSQMLPHSVYPKIWVCKKIGVPLSPISTVFSSFSTLFSACWGCTVHTQVSDKHNYNNIG
jgi:hypothetical protein